MQRDSPACGLLQCPGEMGEDADRGGNDAQQSQRLAREHVACDGVNPNNLLCYEMNGPHSLTPAGFSLRLVAQGWYRIAAVSGSKDRSVSTNFQNGGASNIEKSPAPCSGYSGIIGTSDRGESSPAGRE